VHLELVLCGRFDRILDRRVIRTGIRTLRWDGGSLRLNGDRLRLRGVNQVEEYPDWSCSPTVAQARDRVREIRSGLHGNFIRCAHYPHHPRFLDACDEGGALALSEIPMCYLPAGNDTLRRGLALADAMQWRDAHRPAVILWSAGNERPAEDRATARELVALVGALRRFDPGRPATCVTNRGAADPTLGDCDVLCVNDYTGVWGAPFAATMKVFPAVRRAIHRKLREIHRRHPGTPLVVTEFGGPVFPVPGGRFGSLRWQAAQVRTAIRSYARLPFVAGWAAWCLRDQRINGASHDPAGALGTNVLEVFGLATLDGRPRPAFRAVAALHRRLARRPGA
jgi:beta-glucuronidase